MLDLWGVPLVIGLTMLAVLYYFSLASKTLSNTLQELYRINQATNQDALEFIHQAWPVLHAAGIQGIKQEIIWFGEPVTTMYGRQQGETIIQRIDEGELKATLSFYCLDSRGEKRILTRLLTQTFVLIISSDFSVKRQQVLETREQLSRQQLFSQHDANNLVQFIMLLDEQLKQAKSDADKQALLQQLESGMPAALQRARRLTPTTRQTTATGDATHLPFKPWLEKLATALGVSVNITGDADYHGREAPLIEAFKNVLDNFRQHSQKSHLLDIQIASQPEEITLIVMSEKPAGLVLPPTERMFEPFYTTSNSGMGLGLYLARSALAEIQGTISLKVEENNYGFLIQIKQ